MVGGPTEEQPYPKFAKLIDVNAVPCNLTWSHVFDSAQLVGEEHPVNQDHPLPASRSAQLCGTVGGTRGGGRDSRATRTLPTTQGIPAPRQALETSQWRTRR